MVILQVHPSHVHFLISSHRKCVLINHVVFSVKLVWHCNTQNTAIVSMVGKMKETRQLNLTSMHMKGVFLPEYWVMLS